jgi:hypothetical protein
MDPMHISKAITINYNPNAYQTLQLFISSQIESNFEVLSRNQKFFHIL